MAILAPPPPAQAPNAGVIADARRRRRRRRGRLAASAAALVVAGLVAHIAAVSSDNPAGTGARAIAADARCPDRALGVVAFIGGIDSDSLETVDLRDCRTRVLVRRGASGTPAFSPDGREIAFDGGWVATSGGAVHRTAGQPAFSPDGRYVAYGDRLAPVSGGRVVQLHGTFEAWLPHGDALVLQTDPATAHAGPLELRVASGATRALTRPGWQTSLDAVSPDGRTVVVEHYRSEGGRHPPEGGQLWSINLASMERRLIYAQPAHQIAPFFAGTFSPGGDWLLFSEDPSGSADIPADGVPWFAVRVTGAATHAIATIRGSNDAWCGGQLVYVIDHGGRFVTNGDGIAVTGPPAWGSRTILPAASRTSFSEFACQPSANGPVLALAGGPSSEDSPFGHENRSLWLASVHPGAAGARRIAAAVPPRGGTDELPMWSADGRWLLFIRTRPQGISGEGALYALDLSRHRLVGPIAQVGFTGNFYGTYGWASQLSWYR